MLTYNEHIRPDSGFPIITRSIFFLLIIPLLVINADAMSQALNPLFQNDAILKAVLTAPIAQAYSQRYQDARIYYPGQWTYLDETGQTQRLEVSIRARGHFRREYCDRAPLLLNFKKSEVKGTLFAGQDKLKLVAPCKKQERYQQYVILEYLAYRTFEILTDHSFATRLVRLTYVDRDERLDSWTDIAFVIEDDADLAKRLGMTRPKVKTVMYDTLDHPRTALVQLFQFMIANNDYSVIKGSGDEDCCHNILALSHKDGRANRLPVPFDFDMSGLVNAAYASPPNQVPVRDVRSRYFYGLCQPRDILDGAIAHVQSKREDIVNLYSGMAELDEKLKARTIKYLEEFYEIIDDPERVDTAIVARCRGRNLMDKMLQATTDPT